MRRLENSHCLCRDVGGWFWCLHWFVFRAHNRPIFLGAKRNQRNKSIIYNRHSPMIPNIINRCGIYNYSAIIDTIVYLKIVDLALILVYSPLHFCLSIISPNRRHHTHNGLQAQRSLMDFQGTPASTTHGPAQNNSYQEPFFANNCQLQAII